jgi:general nucleoside transport system permease protein
MSLDAGVLILVTVIGAATPLLLAALGELVVEKSGVLNLGIEGMMLAGAVTAFATAITTGSSGLGILTGALAGALLALIFAVLTMSLLANQVATGLALTIFGIGLSALLGSGFVGTPAERLPRLAVPGMSDLPTLGPLLFRHDFLVYFALFMTAAVAWFLARTRAGMIVRAIGESHEAAHAIGYPVIRIRYLAILFGGVMSGLGGAFLSLSYTPMWVEEMTAGRGWIALALVVFSAWRPWRLLLGAYLFGGVTILQLYAQGSGLFHLPAQLLSMLPYLATIVVLTVISAGPWKGWLNAPACLGKPFHPTVCGEPTAPGRRPRCQPVSPAGTFSAAPPLRPPSSALAQSRARRSRSRPASSTSGRSVTTASPTGTTSAARTSRRRSAIRSRRPSSRTSAKAPTPSA